MTKVIYTVPDFVDPEDGSIYSDIEVIIESDADLSDTARLAGSIEKSLREETTCRTSPSMRRN